MAEKARPYFWMSAAVPIERAIHPNGTLASTRRTAVPFRASGAASNESAAPPAPIPRSQAASQSVARGPAAARHQLRRGCPSPPAHHHVVATPRAAAVPRRASGAAAPGGPATSTPRRARREASAPPPRRTDTPANRATNRSAISQSPGQWSTGEPTMSWIDSSGNDGAKPRPRDRRVREDERRVGRGAHPAPAREAGARTRPAARAWRGGPARIQRREGGRPAANSSRTLYGIEGEPEASQQPIQRAANAMPATAARPRIAATRQETAAARGSAARGASARGGSAWGRRPAPARRLRIASATA